MITYELLSYAPYAAAIVVVLIALIAIFHTPLARLLGRGQRRLEQAAQETEDAYREETHPPIPREEDTTHE